MLQIYATIVSTAFGNLSSHSKIEKKIFRRKSNATRLPLGFTMQVLHVYINSLASSVLKTITTILTRTVFSSVRCGVYDCLKGPNNQRLARANSNI